jgi:hypothetical protein
MDNDKFINIDLTKKDAKFEIASAQDSDLMRILCYATHEGENLNGTIFPPKILINCYRTFIDKPLVIVPNQFNDPTGHGFDYKKQKFDNTKRVQIGHVIDAYPVVVGNDNEPIRVWEAEDLDRDEYSGKELRIVTVLVVYKHYFADIAERLKMLHELGDLKFSMEAVVDAISTEDGGRVCTDIAFTGLAVVDNPAFVRAHSIDVASQKEDEDMDFEKLYQDEKAKNETLTAEKAVVDKELEEVKTELADIKEELANSKAEIANKNAEIESLNVYKEKVETAEKEELGKQRAAKLAKFGVKDADVNELAEKSKDEFADMLIEAAEKMEVASVTETNEVIGLPQHNTEVKSNKEKLLEFLNA